VKDVPVQQIQWIFGRIWGFNQELKLMSWENFRILKNKFWSSVISLTKNFTNREWNDRLIKINWKILA